MTKNKLTIRERNEETRIILLNGEVVAYLTHDALGWEGMKVAQELAVDLASRLGVEIEEEYDEGGEDE